MQARDNRSDKCKTVLSFTLVVFEPDDNGGCGGAGLTVMFV